MHRLCIILAAAITVADVVPFMLQCNAMPNVAGINSDIKARQTADQVTTVDLGQSAGSTQHFASGFLYGIPDTPLQIPDEFYTGMGFNYGRASGAQLGEPARGWIFGTEEFNNRFASAVSNYNTARRYNAQFIILLNDLWGFDAGQPSDAAAPGDGGSWESYDQFIDAVIAGINDNDMTAGLKIDIWNEPDLDIFFGRDTDQWLTMWSRGYNALRSALPDVQLFGPTLAASPTPSSTWWTNFLSHIASDRTIPDAYVWHLEGSAEDPNDDLQTNIPNLNDMLSTAGLPTDPTIVIDEYAAFIEQVPAGAAWWISRFERFNVHGLRGNWLGGSQLHDFMASLLWKPDANDATAGGYFPNGEYQVYKYYNEQMTGTRVATTGSADRLMDSYAVVGDDRVRILVGGRLVTGTYQVTINNLSSVGLPASGILTVQTFEFPGGGGHEGRVDEPTDLGNVDHEYEGDSVSFPIFQTDTNTTWAFEFDIA